MATSVPKRWLGPVLPVTKKSQGCFQSMSVKDLVKSSIITILGTSRGVAPMSPTFGSAFRQLLFEPNDDILRSLAMRFVVEAIVEWEPRVNLDEVQVKAIGNELRIAMIYSIKETGEKVSLNLGISRYSNLALKEVA